MSFTMTYNGIKLPIEVLKVRGRGLASVEDSVVSVAGRDGDYYVRRRLIDKPLEIDYVFNTDNLEEIRTKFDELNSIIMGGEVVPVTFSDEPGKTYYAYLDTSKQEDEYFFITNGTIPLIRQPYKYDDYETDVLTPNTESGTDDFKGKIAGSTKENPHISKTAGLSFVGIPTPSEASFEITDSNYSRIMYLDGSTLPATRTNYGSQGNLVFSFNLIALIKRKFGFTVPGANLAAQVQWLKTNISQITANWWGKGTNKQADPIGIANFVGKVSGSTVENPHFSGWRGALTTLGNPNTDFSTESGTSAYETISVLDGVFTPDSAVSSGQIAQRVFSFNLIEYVQRKYVVTVPGATTADKAQWLKSNLNPLTVNWHGYGSGPAGNKATLKVWAITSWAGTTSHTNGTVTKLTRTDSVNNIDSDGFIHFLAHAEASDGTTASTINTDYVELEVELKAGENRSTISAWRSDANAWNTTVFSQTTDTISKLTHTSQNVSLYVNSDGFFYLIAYAEPSNGISPSTIETDYVDLEVEIDLNSIEIDGNGPSLPIFNVEFTANASEFQIMHGGTFGFVRLIYDFTPGDKVEIDMSKRKITLNGIVNMNILTFDSTWFKLTPGKNYIHVLPDGVATVNYSYRPRWY
ncbi:putative phage tail component-like protein [Cytobacillus firmus]|uniref:Putative phage tail component-like protein n=2 Tax=Cytobacillus TaxID=2675230 RepID=A0A366JNA4_CYTFI|nr:MULTISPECIES: distal tail protein Dit [Cytobacillus]RBP89401.1 putative phage tail component-like protein [Cytobacillus firmus]TDX47372.1 putative phage tail component-like protein [Cytobacillus oceanisediminis]